VASTCRFALAVYTFRNTPRADLWRDLSAFAPGTAFDIYFRMVEAGTDLPGFFGPPVS